MHSDPFIILLVTSIFFIIVTGFILKTLKQPTVVGYLLAGIVIGPFGFAVLTDTVMASRFGSFGVILLMFFVGMEMSLPSLIAKWKTVIIGTILQIAASIGVVALVGVYFNWGFNRILTLGFVISLSSTAVVIKLLKDSNELDSEVGQNVVGVLLAQDVAVIPMILILQLLDDPTFHGWVFTKQMVGFILFLISVIWISMRKEKIQIPYGRLMFSDPEIQVFLSILICFGSAMIFSMLELSTALGAFAAGLAIAAINNMDWVHHHLTPFRVIFISLFFVSVGMQLDLTFLKDNWFEVFSLVLCVFVTNTLLSGFIFKFFGMSWHQSLYAAALLSQIGEFSFVIAAMGFRAGFINQYGFNLAISTIVISLMLTVLWVKPVAKWAAGIKNVDPRQPASH